MAHVDPAAFQVATAVIVAAVGVIVIRIAPAVSLGRRETKPEAYAETATETMVMKPSAMKAATVKTAAMEAATTMAAAGRGNRWRD